MSAEGIIKLTETLTKHFYLTCDFYCDEKSNVLRFELIKDFYYIWIPGLPLFFPKFFLLDSAKSDFTIT